MSKNTPQQAVIAFMRDPENFPHACHKPDEVETNQSRVFLMGDYAYKLFKAISRYRDNTTPEARLENAELEIEANRMLARGLYLGIFAIAAQPDGRFTLQPAEEADATQAADYVVKMRRFDNKDLLYERLFADKLKQHEVYALGAHVARFHQNQAPDSAPVQGNCNTFRDDFAGLIHSYAKKVPCPYATAMLEALHTPTMSAIDKARQSLESRNHSWRLLHGDLDFGNIADFNGQLMPFDAQVLFEGKRSNDTAKDVAYMLAPLYMHGRPDLADSLQAGYQSVAHDRTLETVVPLWIAYACVVRGGSWLSRLEGANTPQQFARMEACGYRYLQVAKRFIGFVNGDLSPF